MSNTLLAAVGEALGNISGAIAECVRVDAQNTPSPPHAEQFEQCLANECRRLRSVEQDGLAGALEALRSPLCRLMTEGW